MNNFFKMFEIDSSLYCENGHKIEIRNVIDKILYPSVEIVCKSINDIISNIKTLDNSIPNIATLTGFCIRALSLIALIESHYVLAGIGFFIGYYLDFIDGFYARKYNKCTEFGCYLDHANDFLMCSMFFILALKKKMWITFILFICAALFSINQVICTENAFNNMTPYFSMFTGMFSWLKSIKCNNIHEKYFGMSTWMTLISLSIALNV